MLWCLCPRYADPSSQVVVTRTCGAKTLAEVLSVSPGFVKVKVNEAGLLKKMPESEVYRFDPLP